MKRLFFMLVALCATIVLNAQKLHIDAKYIKVGVASNSTLIQDDNKRVLDLNDVMKDFDHEVLKKKDLITWKDNLHRINQKHVGKKVLDLLLSRQGSSLNIDNIYMQALDNTTIEDIEEAVLDISGDSKDILKKEIGNLLLKNNYIVVVQEYGLYSKLHWQIFHVDIDDNIIEQAFLCWNDMARYDQISVPVSFVAKGKTSDSKNLLSDIAKRVPQFAVRGPVTNAHPTVARMGSNLGLRKMDRVFVYRFKQSRNGDIYSKRICTARAVDVNPNTTQLYTISGNYPSYKKGDIAVLRDRKKSAMSFMYQGSFGEDPRHGGRFQYEYLLSFSSKGIAQYLIGGFGYNQYKKEPLGMWSPKDEGVQPQWVNYELMVGYGVGFNLWGRLEIMPYGMLGYQNPHFKNSENAMHFGYIEDETTSVPEGCWWGQDWSHQSGLISYWGLKFNVNLFYPFQLTGGADYNLSIYPKRDGSYESFPKPKILEHHTYNRLNVYLGFRISF